MNMRIRNAQLQDIEAITAIYNEGIESGLGTFDTNLRCEQEIAPWLDGTQQYPCLVVEVDREILGWARLFEYRPRVCYESIAEFSIYFTQGATGKGLGKQLLEALLKQAEQKGFHKILSRIFTFNEASRGLCKSLGFREVGIYEKHGKLNGRWLDVVITEYLITANLT